MKTILPLIALLGAGAMPLAGSPAERLVLPQYIPYCKYTQTLVASADCGKLDYLMVPTLLRVDEHRLLLGYKRGANHYREDEAWFELATIDPVSQRMDPIKTDLRQPHLDFQDGEFARFSNGDIACYIDVQSPSSNAVRQGLLEYRSTDGGRTFQDAGKVGLIDGVEYGYAFEAVTRGGATWMLVMRFTNLAGGRPVFGHHNAGSVDVIRTGDNGRTWHLVRDLTAEFHGFPINESSLVPYGDGFIVTTRGYDNRQRLQLTDADFKLRRQLDLNSTYAFVNSYMGRPRVFEHEGRYYLMGRNWTKAGAMMADVLGHDQAPDRNPALHPMQLSLFRLEPDTLRITRAVILDNAEEENVIDGYYGVPYWQERAGREYFDVVTYKRSIGRLPDIIRLEFDWAELK